MNLQTIKTDSYLLLVDDRIGCSTKGNYVYNKLAKTVRILEWNNGADNDRNILAHLPIGNAFLLEGVPVLPEPPKQEEDVLSYLKGFCLQIKENAESKYGKVTNEEERYYSGQSLAASIISQEKNKEPTCSFFYACSLFAGAAWRPAAAAPPPAG